MAEPDTDADPVADPHAAAHNFMKVVILSINRINTIIWLLLSLKKTIQPHITSHVRAMSAEYGASLDVGSGKFFSSTNTAFNVADHPQWKKLIGMLCPGYTPPSSKQVGNELLSEVANSQESMKKLLTGKEGTLVPDEEVEVHQEEEVAVHREEVEVEVHREEVEVEVHQEEEVAVHREEVEVHQEEEVAVHREEVEVEVHQEEEVAVHREEVEVEVHQEEEVAVHREEVEVHQEEEVAVHREEVEVEVHREEVEVEVQNEETESAKRHCRTREKENVVCAICKRDSPPWELNRDAKVNWVQCEACQLWLHWCCAEYDGVDPDDEFLFETCA
ncbi:hypothetical protein CAPTEDRAFT_208561 [Capitella teleta]|uniref:Zinc finger PHD-type domain-containing protein n=1 Tax=Capitella teleta TaxID=283909 RepID=R7UZ20_CAPTE|nr:hypothetical protein CAPTEDRAFT_208561 [Capitella teleta]|eukprot:ELU11522.1 hypothetical protein CAPTEDRAFT_208561 [Capitella teleta]